MVHPQNSKCDVCQHMNRKMTTGTPELHPIPVKSPWHQIGIDFVGPLSPEADDGSRYILTVSDILLSGWRQSLPLTNQPAQLQMSFSRYCMCTSNYLGFLFVPLGNMVYL